MADLTVLPHHDVTQRSGRQCGAGTAEAFSHQAMASGETVRDVPIAMPAGEPQQSRLLFHHVGIPAIGAQCDPRCRGQRRRITDAISLVGARIVHEPTTRAGGQPHLRIRQVHAMREYRAGHQRAQRLQPFQRSSRAAPACIADIGKILRYMHMQHSPQLAGQIAGFADRVVRHGETRMQPNQASHQRRRRQRLAFGQATPRFFPAKISFGRAITEQYAYPEPGGT